jgi:diadenylate cyclase
LAHDTLTFLGSLTSLFTTEIPRLTITAVIDILVVATLIYQFILIVRGRRAAHIVVGVIVLVCIYVASIYLRLELLRTLLATLAPYTAFALIVVFQSDVRRVLARIGRHRFFGFSELERREVADEILLAITQLSHDRIGALIVVERNIGLRTFVESGVNLDARTSRDLLLAIFHPKAPLHDGAVIVHGGRIVAAGCFLPLTTNPAVTAKLGTRHRAAIGVSEETDCLAVVVSEESGRISVAYQGEIQLHVPVERLSQILTSGASSHDLKAPFKPEEPAPIPIDTSRRA